GYGERNYQDPRLPNLASPLIDASLIWTATPLTTVTLKSVSSLNETTIPGASGAAQHATTLAIDHALRRYLTLTGTIDYLTDDYVGVPGRHNQFRPCGQLQPQPRRRSQSKRQPPILQLDSAGHELCRNRADAGAQAAAVSEGEYGGQASFLARPNLRSSALRPGAISLRSSAKAMLAVRNPIREPQS